MWPRASVSYVARGRRFDLQQLEVLVEQLIDGRDRLSLFLIVDLGREPAQRALGFLPGRRAVGDDLTQEVTTLGHRVDPGIDDHTQRTAGQ